MSTQRIKGLITSIKKNADDLVEIIIEKNKTKPKESIVQKAEVSRINKKPAQTFQFPRAL